MRPLLPSWRKLAIVAAAATVALLVTLPVGFGLSGGATKESVPDPAFGQFGCAACHGPVKEFRNLDNSLVSVRIMDGEGGYLNGPYEPGTAYIIVIELDEQVATDGGATGNHAGFNLRASAGKLAGVPGMSQATADGTEATHLNGRTTAWNVTWTSPEAGAVAFQLFVNDVDGSGAPDEPDNVHMLFFGLTDPKGAVLGAAAVEEEVHFGISLQQYWIGIIGLLGMIIIMVAGFVYLKFVSPHNTDEKDR